LSTYSDKTFPGRSNAGIGNVSIVYGDMQILPDANIHVSKGELAVILGSNSAYETTAFNAEAGISQRVRGKILFNSRDILDVPAHERSIPGIILVPEGRTNFHDYGRRYKTFITY